MKKLLLLLLVSLLAVSSIGCDEMGLQTVQPSIDQVKADLIGHVLTVNEVPVWEFAALSEYEDFQINNELLVADALEYDVSVKLIDFAIDTHFRADILIVYKKYGTKWELVSIVTKIFEPIPPSELY